jgi:transducin (beta)-like 1
MPLAIFQLLNIYSSKNGTLNIKHVPTAGKVRDASKDVAVKLASNEDGDLTAIDWNPQGTLLAVGCFDNKVRVITHDGKLYMEGTTHTVLDSGLCILIC